MCGIAGFLTRFPDGGDRSVLMRMTARIAHRGPDATGYWPPLEERSPVWLGHLRLSIVDLATGGQPMSNEDGSLWIIYNGEIFNHTELRPALEKRGHVYRTHSDTETILHAYEEYGPDCLRHFRGMFAFVIWDRNKNELFAARDRLGIKPFYYVCDGGRFVFASEIKALFAHPAVAARPAEDTFAEYLALGFHSGDGTMFEGVRTLPPGHWMRLQMREGEPLTPHQECYWDAPAPSEPVRMTEQEALDETMRRFEETVRMRLMADVPLGMFLSGGVDSSAIAAMIRRITGGPLKTFSVGYAEQAYSELGWASQVAGHIGSEHHEITVSAAEYFAALPDLVYQEDEPIAWPSSIPLYFVSKLARQQVVVVLTGEGADEIFAGYSRYRHYLSAEKQARLWDKLPAGPRAALRRFIAGSPLLGADLRRKLGHTVLGRRSGFGSLYLENFLSAFDSQSITALLPGGGDPYASYTGFYNRHPDANPLQRLLYADQKTYLAELLRKQDRMSMACSIESRVPLLDHTFVEFAASLPAEFKLNGATGKHIFKKAAEQLLPASIVHRPKMGFPTPIGGWLRQEYRPAVEALLSDRQGFSRQFLEGGELDRLLAKTRSGREDTTDRIWRLLTFEIWGRRFFLGKESPLL